MTISLDRIFGNTSPKHFVTCEEILVENYSILSLALSLRCRGVSGKRSGQQLKSLNLAKDDHHFCEVRKPRLIYYL